MTGPFQNDRNKVLFSYEGVVWEFSSFTSSMFLLKLAKNLLAYSKNNGHEEKGILLLNVQMKTHFYFCFYSFFFTEWNNDLLAAFSMHPTTSTTRTCRGEEKRGGGRGRRGGKPRRKV